MIFVRDKGRMCNNICNMDICMLGQGRTIGRRFQCDLLTSINTFISVGLVGIIFLFIFLQSMQPN